MRIDVYDFDGTIYDGDSTVDFTRFCLRRHPAVLAGLPRFIGTSVLLALGRRNLTQFKSVGAVKEATPDQLENTPGVGRQLAQTIYDYFHTEA